ncbi:hypothetical protein HK098_003012 [Nowakowskiella sp. JEL0407]|nr:hypothetical protein HK098_003012 [Nowakowskiella sp. JEL0407]
MDDNSSIGIKRSRTTRACDICRRKRTKCSGNLPCEHCRLFGLDCKFTLPQKKRGPQKRNELQVSSGPAGAALADRLRNVETLLSGLISLPQISDMNEMNQNQPSVVSVTDGLLRATLLQGSGHRLEGSPRPFIPSGWKTPTLTKEFPTQSDPATKSTISEELEITGTAKTSEKVVILEDLTMGRNFHFFGSTMTGLTNGFNFSPRSKSGVITLQYAIESLNFNENHRMDQLPCSLSVLQHLLDLYFNHIHPYFPMISRPELVKQMQSERFTPEFLFLLYSICSLVLFHKSFLGTNDIERVNELEKTFRERARILLGRLFDFPHIYVVQGLILAATGGFAAKWCAYSLIGIAHRQAVELGLHRDVTKLQHLELDDTIETRKKTWMCLYVVDRYVSLIEGRPFGIHDDDWDTPLLTANIDPEMDRLIRHVGLWEIIGRVIKYLNAPTCSRLLMNRDKISVEIIEQLDRWWESLPDFLQRPPQPPTSNDPNVLYGHPSTSESAWGFHHNLHCHYHIARILSQRLKAGKYTPECLKSAYALVEVVEFLPIAAMARSKSQQDLNNTHRSSNPDYSNLPDRDAYRFMDSDDEMESDLEDADDDDDYSSILDDRPYVYIEPIVVYSVLCAAGVLLDKISTEYQMRTHGSERPHPSAEKFDARIEVETSSESAASASPQIPKGPPIYLSTLEGAQGMRKAILAFERLQKVSVFSLYYKLVICECINRLPNLVIDVSGINMDCLPNVPSKPEPKTNATVVGSSSTPRVAPRERSGHKSVVVVTSEEILSGSNNESENREQKREMKSTSPEPHFSPSIDSNAPSQTNTQASPNAFPLLNNLLNTNNNDQNTAMIRNGETTEEAALSMFDSTCAQIRIAQHLLQAQQRADRVRERAAQASIADICQAASEPYTSIISGDTLEIPTNQLVSSQSTPSPQLFINDPSVSFGNAPHITPFTSEYQPTNQFNLYPNQFNSTPSFPNLNSQQADFQGAGIFSSNIQPTMRGSVADGDFSMLMANDGLNNSNLVMNGGSLPSYFADSVFGTLLEPYMTATFGDENTQNAEFQGINNVW